MSQEGGRVRYRKEWIQGLSCEAISVLAVRDNADPQELNLPHSPRTVIVPSGSGVPDTVHMLYSTTTSAILRIDPTSKPPLSVTDLPNTPLPTASGSQARDTAAPTTTTTAETSTAGGLGGAFSGLGGYVGLGGKAAVPVGTRTFGGEVLLGRQGKPGADTARKDN